MSAHTPGPWKFMDIIGACSVHAGSRCLLSYDYSPDAENRANARLIAAAPDYDFAAREMVDRHDNAAKLANFQACGCDDCKPFRAIIAKAEGKT